MSYRVISHTADTGIEVWADTQEELFVEAATGMFSLMYEPTGTPTRSIEVEAVADSLEDLLVEWLSELLYLSEGREIAMERFEISSVEGGRVSGRAWGTDLQAARLVGPPVKAVTYHQLQVGRHEDRWQARVIFDV